VNVPASDVDLDALLSDTGIVRIRTAQRSDVAAIREMYDRVSADALYLRFFTFSGGVVAHEVEAQTRPGGDDHASLVAQIRGHVVGVASFERLDSGSGRVSETAEVAFFVDDTHRGRGVGMLLLEELAAIARERGIVKFVADTLPGNTRMLHLFADAGLPVTTEHDAGVVRVGLELRCDEAFRSAVDRREALADAISLRRVLAPRSVVVVGVGRQSSDPGPQILANIRRGEYAGELYAVGSGLDQSTGAVSYADLDDVPGPLDLVIVAAPAATVLAVAATAAARGAAGFVVVTGGFAESGTAGAELQADLVRICRDGGMRLIGPNSTGICVLGGGVSLNGTFCVTAQQAGHIGVMSQSGIVGMATLDYAARTRVGISTFVSAGNKADVSGNDLLCAWENDDDTTVCALYLESVGNRQKFARIAARVGRRKPVVVINPGHDRALDDLFDKAGVTRVDTLAQLFGLAALFDLAPLPRGPRVGIVADERGAGTRAAHACTAAGLVVARLDLGATAPAAFEVSLRAALSDGTIDAVIAVSAPGSSDAEGGGVASVIAALHAEGAGHAGKPLLVCFSGLHVIPAELGGTDRRPVVPYFVFPDAAAYALAGAVRYAQWRTRANSQLEGIDSTDSTEVIDVWAGATSVADPLLRRLR
jgi:acyl-CoA synthetase (NDP forming)/GNAT superfamily N-acetyltransferase